MPVHNWTRVDAGVFHHFHGSWVVELSRALNNGVLPDSYYAMSEQVTTDLGPDVLALERINPDPDGPETPPHGTLTLALVSPKTRIKSEVESEPDIRKRRTLVIRHRSGDRVVALIEIVSAGNKGSRHGFRAFVRK